MDFKLDRNKTMFLFIDIQDSLANAIYDKERMLHYAGVLADTAEIMKIPTIFTTQYKKGLGEFTSSIRSKVSDAVDFDKNLSPVCWMKTLPLISKGKSPSKLLYAVWKPIFACCLPLEI